MVFELSSLPSGTRDLLRDEIQAGLGRPTPILQSLTMVQVPSSSLTVQQTISSAPNPFSGHAPRLRTIDLQKSDFNFDSSAFCHLTWLSIVDPIRRSTVDVFLRAVREMSELRYLKLQNVFGRGTSIQFDGRVDLPHLVDLIIHEFGGSVQEDFTFLEHLTIPPATHLTLFSHIRSFNEAAFPRFTYIYARARRSFLDIPISTLHFKWLGDTFHLKVWIYSPRTGSLIQTLCLGFIGLRRTPARSCLWANELSYWPLAELRAFETNCDMGFESWKHTFGALQGLRTIHVEGNYAGYGFLQYLVHNHEHDCPLPDEIELRDPDGDPASDLRSWSKVAFPNLTDLRLMGISFDTTVDVRRLLNSLCARQDQGFGLDELTIFDCTAVGFENMVESLDTIVPAITWDGWQR
ncbi:hypothetical protein BDN72DRAFT_845509 [Pluteus cervinus]|uniref:Uncharacterized protein n=1 Tax=Pluteus cervinus TaxID=181527 RepID=A0ACD3AJG2_9AGAR|nr:hypothetical protein BDN72DRAFT_845509 [Pluteus cervinus]